MASDVILDRQLPRRDEADTRVLYVAWQNPATRSITPVGRLSVSDHDGVQEFEFRYLARARQVLARAFTSFPHFDSHYRSVQLFPFFENRVVSTRRADFEDWAAAMGIAADADPFELLSSTGGLRATDTLEIFPEPSVDVPRATASFRFLVRGVRHCEGADDEIDRLHPGDGLYLQPENANVVDPLALLVLPDTGRPVGWVPAYLCTALHRSAADAGGWGRIATTVRHIGDRSGPSHFRVLCDVVFPWPFPDRPFDTPEFAVASTTHQERRDQ